MMTSRGQDRLSATMHAVQSLSVVMPAYNEIGNIHHAVADVRHFVLTACPDLELVVVDDGSTDGTGQALDALASGSAWIKVVHQPNAGHGPALRHGIQVAQGEWLLLLDSDSELNLESFRALWPLDKPEVAILGLRTHRRSTLDRRLTTTALRLYLMVASGVWTRDPNCPFKLVPRWLALQALAPLPQAYPVPSAWIAAYTVRSRTKVLWTPLECRPRPAGTTSVNKRLVAKFAWAAIKTIPRLRQSLANPVNAE